MSGAVIRVEGIGKRYRVGEHERYTALRDVLARAFTAPFRRNGSAGRKAQDWIWALKDVTFEVKPGEVVGLIGRNGAGKSTLLKVLSRITKPTEGYAEVHGRVGSLLEVGTGFHPELTGRENIFLNGAILGMRKAEIARKFDQIAAFAEIERFLDTPVKYYSSGMYVRLAFAVAAHLEMEILFVDEVLAVGDASFQKKCLGRMGEVSREGRTIVFVSHNMAALQTLCKRGIWLDGGMVVRDGQMGSVVSEYLAQFSPPPGQNLWPDPKEAPGNDVVRIRKAGTRLADGNGERSERLTVRTPFLLEFEYWVLKESRLSLSIHVFSEDGARAFNTFPRREPELLSAGLYRSCCQIPGDLLNDGTYRVLLLIVRDQSEELFTMEDALVFEIEDARFEDVRWHGKIRGAVRPILEWTTEAVAEPEFRSLAQVSLSQAPPRT